ncbi:MAG: hypothetical protein MUF81_18055 [Verrucomicrobia bacterium]|jgi:hypothetical protein|nr:hypothetical protein [Verrucomicrobiota bacterium]
MTAAPPTVSELLSQADPGRAEEARKGMGNIRVQGLEAGELLYRFSAFAAGPVAWISSPWWISRQCYQTLLGSMPETQSNPHALSPDIVARMALALPHYWEASPASPLNLIDLLVEAVLTRNVWALVGDPRAQRETAPNGMRITWSGSPKVKQLFLPELAPRKAARTAAHSAFSGGKPSPVISRATLSPSAPLVSVRRTLKVPSHPLFTR